jgi:hypothetical protein
MAREMEPRPPIGPTLPPGEAIKLLRGVVAKGRQMLGTGGMTADDAKGWKTEADQALADALGPDHSFVSAATTAGAPVLSLAMQPGDLARRYAQSLPSQLRHMEETCIPFLERQPDQEARMRGGSWYDAALVCRKGHVINDSVQQFPQHNSAFCEKCGAEAVSQCAKCSEPIRGEYHVPGVITLSASYKPPPYCHKCGSAFPWTDALLRALSEYLEIVGATESEQSALTSSVPALVADSPETTVAVAKWKRYLAKAGKEVASGVKNILVDVISDVAKRSLFP